MSFDQNESNHCNWIKSTITKVSIILIQLQTFNSRKLTWKNFFSGKYRSLYFTHGNFECLSARKSFFLHCVVQSCISPNKGFPSKVIVKCLKLDLYYRIHSFSCSLIHFWSKHTYFNFEHFSLRLSWTVKWSKLYFTDKKGFYNLICYPRRFEVGKILWQTWFQLQNEFEQTTSQAFHSVLSTGSWLMIIFSSGQRYYTKQKSA